MPWVPEMFSAPVVQRLLDQHRRDEVVSMGFFEGLMADEPDAPDRVVRRRARAA